MYDVKVIVFINGERMLDSCNQKKTISFDYL